MAARPAELGVEPYAGGLSEGLGVELGSKTRHLRENFYGDDNCMNSIVKMQKIAGGWSKNVLEAEFLVELVTITRCELAELDQTRLGDFDRQTWIKELTNGS